MSQPITNKPFSEVIESSLQGWVAQSWQWNQFPSFGSLVAITGKKRIIFGIVHQIHTGSMDPVRYPFPYKKTEEELLKEQPQIFEFLKTTFSCLTVGYMEAKTVEYLLAPEPPTIHSFVTLASPNLQQTFFSKTDYLHLIFGYSGQSVNLDELLLAILTYQTKIRKIPADMLNQFIDLFSLLTGNDYRRLKMFLSRVQHIIK